MQRFRLTTGVVLVLVLSSCAQSVDPVPAPADVVLKLETEGNRLRFYLGELIPVRYSYTAKTPGRYVWVGQSSTLAEGRSLEISCSPLAERVSSLPKARDVDSFAQMLQPPCDGEGIGGGIGGGCVDCDGELPLTTAALTFGVVPLNTYVRFRTPGTYTCEASSADITATSRDEKLRPALLVTSNPIVLTITNDPAWAHAAEIAYADAYDKLCGADDAAVHPSLQCFDVARRITYLDTVESLTIEVKAFDGRSHGWESGFWDAIQQSSYPQEALNLMASRMQQPDFQVSPMVLEWLASSELRLEVPDAFQTDTPATYHAQAVEKMRKYVRLLGSSLSRKNLVAISESAKTYRAFAGQTYCERQLLISTEEQDRVLTGLDIRP